MSLESRLCARLAGAFPLEIPATPRVGAEVEFLALRSGSRETADYDTETLPAVRRHALAQGWVESRSAKGTVRFRAPHGGAVTFEPGGQIEYATPPFATPRLLVEDLETTLAPMLYDLACDGVELIAAGIDPYNDAQAAALQVDSPRYRSMDAYFAAIGPAGTRMMRQTASVQINVDVGAPTADVWWLLNALAPYLTAIFANSAVYAGAPSGWASYRARTWQELDPTRTGLWSPRSGARGDEHRPPGLAQCIAAYAERAARAPMIGRAHGAACEVLTSSDLDDHLTTLFPEVRPRGYLEVRSIDAVPPSLYPAAILLVSAPALDTTVLRELQVIIGPPDEGLLSRAAQGGLQDQRLRDGARALVELCVQAAERRGPEWLDERSLDSARRFFAEYTLCGRSPAQAAPRSLATNS